MLIRAFKSSFYAQYLLLIALAAGLWVPRLFHTCSTVEVGRESPLFSLIVGIAGPDSIVGIILSFFLLLITAWLFNFFLIRHEILPKNTLIGAIVFVILMSHPLVALGINPVLTSALIIVLAFDRMLNTYGKADPTQDVFSATFLASLASLIYFPSAILFVLLLLSFMLFGNFSLRILMIALSGIVAVYLYLLVIYFLNDDLEQQYSIYAEWIKTMPEAVFPLHWMIYTAYGMIILLFIAGLLYVFSHLNEWNISVRKKTLMSMYFALLSILTLFYERDNLPVAILLAMIPISVIIAAYLAGRRKNLFWLEVYVILLYCLSLVNNIFFSTC